MDLLARVLRIATIVLVIAVCVVLIPQMLLYFLSLLWVLSELIAVGRGCASLSTLGLTSLMWVAYRIHRTERPAGRASSGAKVSTGGVYRASVALLRSASEADGEPAVANDLRFSCEILGVLGIVIATPFVASRISALLFGTVPAAVLAKDPSIVVGVPLIFAAWSLLVLRKNFRGCMIRRIQAVASVAVLVLCALAHLWIATGHVLLVWSLNFEKIIARGMYRDADNLPDLVGGRMAQLAFWPSGKAGPFFTPWPSWQGTLAALLGCYAALLLALGIQAVLVLRALPPPSCNAPPCA